MLKIKKLLKNFYITFITILLILILDFFIGDYVSKNIIKANDLQKNVAHLVYHHELKKNLNKFTWYNNVFKHQICTDIYGFKTSCKENKRDMKKSDFAFIGDSFTEGLGLNYEDTFVGMFANRRKDQKIVNLGVESYSPKIYYKKIQYLINDGFVFKNLIIFFDISDILNENFYTIDEHGNISTRGKLDNNSKIYSDYKFLFRMKKLLKENFVISYFLYRQFKIKIKNLNHKNLQNSYEIFNDKHLIHARSTFENKYSNRDKRWIEFGKKESLKYIDEIYKLGKKNNFTISLAVYPWPSQILYDNDTARKTLGQFWRDYCDNKCKYFINYLEVFHDLKKERSSENIVKDYYFKSDVHFNQKGNHLIFLGLDKIIN